MLHELGVMRKEMHFQRVHQLEDGAGGRRLLHELQEAPEGLALPACAASLARLAPPPSLGPRAVLALDGHQENDSERGQVEGVGAQFSAFGLALDEGVAIEAQEFVHVSGGQNR